jgi:uncharacterized protein with PIN domain
MDDEIPEHLLAQGYLINRNEPALEVRHAELEPFGEGAFKRRCPKCKEGILPVTRNQRTLQLLAYDRCTRCAQLVVYLDQEINGEALQRPN